MNISLYKVELVKEKGVRYNIDGNKLSHTSQVVQLACDLCKLDRQCEEVLIVVAVDSKNKPLGLFEVSRGTLNSSMVHPREIFKRLLVLNASSFFILHNHPSKDPTPSNEDIAITKRLKECGLLLGVPIIDHIIVGDYEKYYSLAFNRKA